MKEVKEQLHRIETELEVIKNDFRHSMETNGSNHTKVAKDMDSIMTLLLRGNGHPPLLTRIDRLENYRNGLSWHLRVLWTAIITVIIKAIYDSFN